MGLCAGALSDLPSSINDGGLCVCRLLEWDVYEEGFKQ